MQFRSVLKMFALAASLSLFVACGGDDDDGGPTDPPMSILGECPTGADTTAGQAVFDASCAGCHAGFSDANARTATPADTMDDCTDGLVVADCMYQRAMEMTMPPGGVGALSDAQVEDLRIWLVCNQP